MANIALKAGPTVHVVLVRVSRDEEGRAILRSRGQLYDVDYKGKPLLKLARFPFYDSARKLKELGAGDDDVISMRWSDQPQTTSMAGRIGWAATRTIEEYEAAGPHERNYRQPFANLEEANNAASPFLP